MLKNTEIGLTKDPSFSQILKHDVIIVPSIDPLLFYFSSSSSTTSKRQFRELNTFMTSSLASRSRFLSEIERHLSMASHNTFRYSL